jgi:hypothetical protein
MKSPKDTGTVAVAVTVKFILVMVPYSVVVSCSNVRRSVIHPLSINEKRMDETSSGLKGMKVL